MSAFMIWHEAGLESGVEIGVVLAGVKPDSGLLAECVSKRKGNTGVSKCMKPSLCIQLLAL